MKREEMEAEIKRLQAELDKGNTTLLRISGKPVKIVYQKEIGRGRYKGAQRRRFGEQQEKIPVIVVKNA